MTIGELLRLAKTNLIEDAYYAIESLITGSNANLEGEITPTLKAEIEEELALYDYEWSDLVFVDNIKLENKIDVKQVFESVVKRLRQEGRYFQEKDNIKKMVLKEAMDLAKVKNNKQVIANKMRGGKVQLKEGISYLDLQKGETYTWTGGAEYTNIFYIGKTSENPEVKIGSSMGKGLLFQWSDGKYFELSPNAVKKYVNIKDLEESKKSNKRPLKEGSYDDFRDHYGKELNACLRILRAFEKKIDKEEITDKQWSKLQRTLSVYDEMVQRFILNPNSYMTGHDIVNLAIENQNKNGTEMKMVINAIDDLGGVLGLGSTWYEEEEDEDEELDEAVTVPVETLEKGIDRISKVAEKTDITITENKQYKMKTKEEKIKSLTEAIQKMTGKKVLLKEYPNAIADKVVRSKHIDPLTKSRYAMSKTEQGPSDNELEDINLDNLDLDDDFSTEDTRIFDESTGSASAKEAAGKPRLQEGTSLNEDVTDMIDGLIDDTIIPALAEDFNFQSSEEAQAALNYLAETIRTRNVNSFYSEELEEASNATMDKIVRSKHIDQATKDKYAKDKVKRRNPHDMTGKIVDNFPFQGRMAESAKRRKIKALTESIQRRTGKKVVLAEKKKDVIKTLKEEITKRAKLVYYIKTGKKVTLKETAGEEGTTLEDQVNLENNIDTPTLGNIMPTSIIKTIEQYVSTTLAEIDKSTTELRTIKKNIVLNSGPSDGSFETLINRIGFLLKQLERVQRYTSNTIKAGVFNKSILDKIFEQKELLNEIK